MNINEVLLAIRQIINQIDRHIIELKYYSVALKQQSINQSIDCT
jgi:hypothetical protein